MTRIFTEGFETGDNLFWNVTGNSTSLAGPRSGLRCLSLDSNGVLTKTITAVSEAYFRIPVKITSAIINQVTQRFLVLSGATSMVSFTNVQSITPTHLTAQVGASTVATGTTWIFVNVWYLVEIYIKIADSGGRIVVKVDGITDIDYTGDTKPSTETTFDTIQLLSGAASSASWDDIAMNDTAGSVDNSWCGDGHVVRLNPNAVGSSSQWIPLSGSTNYLMVDEVPPDGDTTYVSASVVNLFDLYKVSGSSTISASPITISRLWVEARAKDSSSSGCYISVGLKSGSTTLWGGSQVLLGNYTTTNFKTSEYLVDIDSGLPWTGSMINLLECGIKAV